ncbi:hypothetical protein CO641_12025 [Lysobacteraceae bacterium NML91-0213]|nr:hypothetical protein CO641_12025 [Xanthomonadaceae bacterium NML91-0213]
MSARAPLHGRIALGTLALAIGTALQAAELPSGFATQNDWGGVGLLQTPTARMADEGQIGISTSYTSPYARHNLSMQPFPWLEGSFRYVGLRNLRYGRESLSGDQSYKDKSIDFKLRLWPESRWIPQVAVGMRDMGGTGLFASEYLVASKRFGSFDASLGVATGYMGHRGDLENPLGWIIDDFGDRPPRGSGNNQFNTNRVFRGPLGVFGGVSWQTPLDALVLKLELDGNDYKREPGRQQLDQALPVNLGLVYRPNANIELTAGIERGNTAVVGLAITGNLKHAHRNAQLLDTPPPTLKAPNGVPGEATPATDWPDVAAALRRDAGIRVRAISQRDRELIVHGEQTRYMYGAQGVGRAARVLDGVAGDSVDWVTVAHERVGLPIAETSVERAAFADYINHQQGLGGLARKVEVQPPALQRRHTLYEAPFDRWSYGFGPGYRHVMGGPDGFILYQVTADARGTWWFNRNTWLTGTVSVDLINNFDKFRYDAPSRLPRVRTYQRQFLTTSDVMVPNLQLTHVRQLGRDWYGMAYAGYLEYMYGGVGGEVLYRPFGERWAVGMDINHVRQRDFDQRAGFRDYDITTGHVTGYFTLGHAQRIQGSVSAGRYLAGDLGATVSLARRFDNGVTMGAYATKTNVSSRDFGEGDFDKGIYFSVPMDFILPRPSRARATILWQPLYRDGGARLQRRYGLHSLTAERDAEFLLDNLHLMDD